MDDIDIERVADPELREPILVEGLPGVGHVGKLAAEHLVEEFESTVVRRLYTTEFPPQVDVGEDGVAELTHATFHAVDLSTPTPTDPEDDEGDESDDEDGADDPGDAGAAATDGGEASSSEEAEPAEDAADDGEAESDDSDDEPGAGTVPTDRDLLVLTGDHQAGSNAGHYHLAEAFLDIAEEFGVETVYALGGVPTGELIDEHDVLGSVTDASMKADLEDAGVEFRAEEPAGGIVGVSGLMLGLGGRRGLEAACLMGETSGYLVDPKSASAVLSVIESVVGFEVDFSSLEARAEEMEEVVGKIQEMQEGQGVPSDDELRYIG